MRLDLDQMAEDAYRDHSEPHDDCRAPILHRVIAMAREAATPPVAPRALDWEKMARWIDQHYIGSVDHACHECLPGGPMVVPGFLCAPHTARLWLARLTAEEPERT